MDDNPQPVNVVGTTVDDALREHIDAFARENALSAREHEILLLLLKQGSSTEHISVIMGISPNTANNHLKNVFAKVKVAGRADLLAHVTRWILRRVATARVFAKKPRLAVLSNDVLSAAGLAESLQEMGVITMNERDGERVMDIVRQWRPDFVMADLVMEPTGGTDVERRIRVTHPGSPMVFLVGPNAEGPGGVRSPVDARRFFFELMDRYIDAPYDRGRFTRVDTPEAYVEIPLIGRFPVGNVGCGGAFVRVSVEDSERLGLVIGKRVRGRWCFGEGTSPMEVSGEIVWARAGSGSDGPVGVGLRFIEVSEDDRAALLEFVRARRVRDFVGVG